MALYIKIRISYLVIIIYGRMKSSAHISFLFYCLLNTTSFISFLSRFVTPCVVTSSTGISIVIFPENDTPDSNVITMSNDIFAFISSLLTSAFCNNVPSCFNSSSFDMYSFPVLLTILNTIVPP